MEFLIVSLLMGVVIALTVRSSRRGRAGTDGGAYYVGDGSGGGCDAGADAGCDGGGGDGGGGGD